MDLLKFHLDNVNWLAVVIAILPSFVIGSVWYMPRVFGNYWRKASRLTAKDFKNVSFARQVAITTLMNLIMVTGLAVLMSATYLDGVVQGAVLGALVSLAFAATSRGVHLAFEAKPAGLFFLNGAYDLLFLTLAGAILGAF